MVKRIKNRITFLFNSLRYLIFNLLSQKPIKVYYWKDHKNFGDLLTPALLKHYSYQPHFFYPHRAQVVSTGSLIEHINTDYKGVILGTGAIDENTKVQFPNATIVALRGTLTKRLLHINKEITLGDPGLLADRLLASRSTKKYKIGLVPHYADWGNIILNKIRDRYPNQVLIIDVQNSPLKVLTQIDTCEHILSSSMHGLICSDSLGIPNRWILLSPLLGGDFKFRDYYSVFDTTPKPLTINGSETIEELISQTVLIDSIKIEKVKARLEAEFTNLLITIYGH